MATSQLSIFVFAYPPLTYTFQLLLSRGLLCKWHLGCHAKFVLGKYSLLLVTWIVVGERKRTKERTTEIVRLKKEGFATVLKNWRFGSQSTVYLQTSSYLVYPQVVAWSFFCVCSGKDAHGKRKLEVCWAPNWSTMTTSMSLYHTRDLLAVLLTCSTSFLTSAGYFCVRVRAIKSNGHHAFVIDGGNVFRSKA